MSNGNAGVGKAADPGTDTRHDTEGNARRNQCQGFFAATAKDPSDSATAVAGVQAKFDALDTNHDGFIDQAEAAASDVLAGQFATLDASGDGKLSLAEFTAARNLASIRIDHRNHQE